MFSSKQLVAFGAFVWLFSWGAVHADWKLQ